MTQSKMAEGLSTATANSFVQQRGLFFSVGYSWPIRTRLAMSLVSALGTKAPVRCMTGHIGWYSHPGLYQIQSKVKYCFVSVSVQQSKNKQNKHPN